MWRAFTTKSWWNLRTGSSLRKEFMMAKYSRRVHPTVPKWRSGQCHNRRALCKMKTELEKNQIWIRGEGNISFWYDNQTRQGALIKYLREDSKPSDISLIEAYENGEWQYDSMHITVPEAVKRIIEQQKLCLIPEISDKSIWMANNNGNFTVSSVWEILR